MLKPKILFLTLFLLIQCKPRLSSLKDGSQGIDSETKEHAELSYYYLNYKSNPLVFLPQPIHYKQNSEQNIEDISGEDPITRILDLAFDSRYPSVRYLAVEIFFEIAFRNSGVFNHFKYDGKEVFFEELKYKLMDTLARPETAGRVCGSYLECLRKIEHLVAISRNVHVVPAQLNYPDELSVPVQPNDPSLGRRIMQLLYNIEVDAPIVDEANAKSLLVSIVRHQAQLAQVWAEFAMRSDYFSLDASSQPGYTSAWVHSLSDKTLKIISNIESSYFQPNRLAKLHGDKTAFHLAAVLHQINDTGRSLYTQFFGSNDIQAPNLVQTNELSMLDEEADELLFYSSLKKQLGDTIRQTYQSSTRLWHLLNRFKSKNPQQAYQCIIDSTKQFYDKAASKAKGIGALNVLLAIEIEAEPRVYNNCLNRPLHPENALGIFAPSLEVAQKSALDPYRNVYLNFYKTALQFYVNYQSSINTDNSALERVPYYNQVFSTVSDIVNGLNQQIDSFLASNGFPYSLKDKEIYLAEQFPGFISFAQQMQRTQKELLDQQRLFYTLKFIVGNITPEDKKAYLNFFQGDPLAKAVADSNVEQARREIQALAQPDGEFKLFNTYGNIVHGFKKVRGSFNSSWTRQQYEKEMTRLSVYNLSTPLKFACLNYFSGSGANTFHSFAEQEKAQMESFISRFVGCQSWALGGEFGKGTLGFINSAFNGAPEFNTQISNFQPAQNGNFPLSSVCAYNKNSVNHLFALENRIEQYLMAYQNRLSCREFSGQLVTQVASTFLMGPSMQIGFKIGAQASQLIKASGSRFMGSFVSKRLANIVAQRFPVLAKSEIGPGLSGLLQAWGNHGTYTLFTSLTYRSGAFLANSALNGFFFTIVHKALMIPLGTMPVQLEKGETFWEALDRSKWMLTRDLGQGVAFAMLGPAFDGPARWFNVHSVRLLSKGLDKVVKNKGARSALSYGEASLANSMALMTEEAMFYPVDYAITQGTYWLEEKFTGKPVQKESFAEYIGQNFVGVMVMRRRQIGNIGSQLLQDAQMKNVLRQRAALEKHQLATYQSGKRSNFKIRDVLADLGVYQSNSKVNLTSENALALANDGYAKIMETFDIETLSNPKHGYSAEQLAYFHYVRLRAAESIKFMRDPQFRDLFIKAYNNPGNGVHVDNLRQYKSFNKSDIAVSATTTDHFGQLFPQFKTNQFKMNYQDQLRYLQNEKSKLNLQRSQTNDANQRQALNTRISQIDKALAGPYANESSFNAHQSRLITEYSFNPKPQSRQPLDALEEQHFEDQI